MLAVFEAQLSSAREQHREIAARMPADLGASHHQGGVIEQGTFARFDGFQFVGRFGRPARSDPSLVPGDAPLDVGETGEKGKIFAVATQGLVSWPRGVVKAGVLGIPMVVVDGTRDVKTGQTSRITLAPGGRLRFSGHDFQSRQGQRGSETTKDGAAIEME